MALADTIHVKDDYSTIQDAIDAASDSDIILIADGIYTGEENKNLDFKGKAITVQSENGPENCIIDCEDDGVGFSFQNGEGTNSIVSGLTIKNGVGKEWNILDCGGGGIYCENSSPTIDNCIITENRSEYGGGIFVSGGSPTISNCTIAGNYSLSTTGGGGISLNETSAIIINCTIAENEAGGTYAAGGIFCQGGSPTVSNCTITGNWVTGTPNYGGGINSYNSSLLISDCFIMNNSAGFGGGISFLGGFPTIIRSRIIENISSKITSGGGGGGGGIYCGKDLYFTPTNAIISNCLIKDNTAGHGGGISCYDGYATITNCTITGNSASESASGAVYANASINIINSILWSNSPGEITFNPIVKYSIIEGGFAGQGNINMDPSFLNPASGDYHLSDYSPAIGTGTSVEAPNTDIEGNLRPNPNGSNPDIGAYENILDVRMIPTLDIFGFAIGNHWSYDSNIQRKITKIDQTTFPQNTYVMEILMNNSLIGTESYETTNEEVLLWGIEGFSFTNGLTVAWFPLSVGEKKKSSGGVVGYPGVTATMDVTVLNFEELSFSFGLFDAYKLRYHFTASGPGVTGDSTYDWWIVPYLGVVKQETLGGEEILVSFAIDEGRITQNTDIDSDGLKDYLEILIYNTNPSKSDTDSDGMPDGWEVTYALSPLSNDSNEDPDKDGFRNIIEYNRGTDPQDPTSYPSIAMPWLPLLLGED